jgi:hypothetical protein
MRCFYRNGVHDRSTEVVGTRRSSMSFFDLKI